MEARRSSDAIERFRTQLGQMMPLLRERYGVSGVGLFGSFVHGRQRKGSDLDVLVEFSEPPSLLKYVELEDYLGQALGVKVDLVMRSVLKPRIGERILAELVPV